MKTLVFFLLLSFSCLTVVSQNLPLENVLSDNGYLNGDNVNMKEGKNKIVGSTFLTKNELKPIVIKTVGGKAGTFDLGTFDVRTGKFVLKKDGVLYAVEDGVISEIEFLGYTFKKVNGVFHAMISEGETSLIKKYQLDIIPGSIDPMSKEQISPDRYQIKEIYFLLKNDGTPQEVKLKKKSILKKLTKDQANQAKKIAKEEKLSFKKEKDLKRIFNNINQR